MRPDLWRWLLEVVAWCIASAWLWRVSDAVKNMPLVTDLRSSEWDHAQPQDNPLLTVVVPARDEAEKLAATLDSLMAQEYAHLQVVVVDDRSSDATGAIADNFAHRFPDKLRVLHVTELPPGWLGKTYAMQFALQSSESEYVLFTDADVRFSPSVLRRALAFAVSERADHLVVAPTAEAQSWGEEMVLGFFQILGMWAARPWKIADPKAKRDVVGVGAFNMVRRDALAAIGGLLPQRMTVLEDITLGRRMKVAGMRQRIAFAPGLVLVHWARGVRGLVSVMTKNLFSAFNFRPLLALGMVAWILLFCIAPLAGLFWWGTLLPGLLTVLCVLGTYTTYGMASGITRRSVWFYPLGAIVMCWAIVRSMAVVWKDGGVRWRGTLYPLRELREHNSQIRWMRVGNDFRGELKR